MAQQLDTSKGWCCDGRTWSEHAEQGGSGKCCQPQGKQIDDLPAEGKRKAQERMARMRNAG